MAGVVTGGGQQRTMFIAQVALAVQEEESSTTQRKLTVEHMLVECCLRTPIRNRYYQKCIIGHLLASTQHCMSAIINCENFVMVAKYIAFYF